jgi:hypothetical protein
VLKKKIWANFQRIIELFAQKIVTKLSKVWVWDPGSQIRDPEKTYSGSRIQGSKRHRIPDPGSATLENFILQALFQSAQHTYHKREGSGAGSVPLRIRESQKSADPDVQHCKKRSALTTLLLSILARTQLSLPKAYLHPIPKDVEPPTVVFTVTPIGKQKKNVQYRDSAANTFEVS